ncbi:hypothetical protein V8E52_008692 [Russula decolorans]
MERLIVDFCCTALWWCLQMNPYSVLSKNPTPKAAIRPNQDLCPEPVPAELVTEQEHCWAFSVLAYWTPLYKCFSPTTY